MTQTLDTFFSIYRFPQRKETAYSNDEEETKNMIGSLHQSFINIMHPFVYIVLDIFILLFDLSLLFCSNQGQKFVLNLIIF